MTRAASILAFVLGSGACRPLPPRPFEPPPDGRPAEALAPAPRPPTLRRAEGTLAVQLGDLAGRESVLVRGSSLGEVELVRHGSAVRLRGQSRSEWLLAPAAGGGALRIEARSYPGHLRVRPRAQGGLEVSDLLDLEDYVACVLAAELSLWVAPPAQLEAQAVAARSYAVAELDHRGRSNPEPYLYDDTRDQVFGGLAPGAGPGRGASAAQRASAARARSAVEATRGLVLLEGSSVVDARFHAACGGRTADGWRVFPENRFASLRAVECEPCQAAQGETWSVTLSPSELDRLAQVLDAGAPLSRLEPSEVDAAGRWIAVTLEGSSGRVRFPLAALRRAVGAERLPSGLVLSTWPRAGEPITSGLALRGRGRGHGVGLCQQGARGYAERGWSSERILGHYYPGAVLADGR